jgi:RNA polymerase sigma-70 factor (ECF subfamily)
MAAVKTPSADARAEARERALVQAAQQDPSRFAELYEANFARVYGYIARRVPNRAAAEDLTSDVFHRALRGLPDFDWRGIPFAAWLLRIAANLLADRWRDLKREAPLDDAEDLAMSYTPQLDKADAAARVAREVDKLPGEQRQVIYARFTLGKSIREIADELHRTEGSVKQLQFRAVKKIRAALEGQHA